MIYCFQTLLSTAHLRHYIKFSVDRLFIETLLAEGASVAPEHAELFVIPALYSDSVRGRGSGECACVAHAKGCRGPGGAPDSTTFDTAIQSSTVSIDVTFALLFNPHRSIHSRSLGPPVNPTAGPVR